MDVSDKAASGVKAVRGVAYTHPMAVGVTLGLVVFLVIRYRNQLASRLGAWLPAFAKRALAITSLALVFGATLLLGSAEAATCCAAASHAIQTVGGAVSGAWDAICNLAIFAATAGGALGMVAFPAPDCREAKLLKGSKFVTYDLATDGEPSFDFYVDGSSPVSQQGEPLMALDEVLEISATYEQISTGTNPIYDMDLARTVKGVTMNNDLIGTMLDETVGTGPILKQLIEFVGLGYNRGGDAPVATLTVPAVNPADTTYKRLFTIPHALRFLANPIVSALWLGVANDTRITVKMNSKDCLASVSTGALIKGTNTLRVTTPYVPHKAWHWPVVPCYTLEQALAGSKTFTLRRFGEGGPKGTDPIDYLFLVSLLTNKAGLPGNTTLDNILQIDSEKLGIVKMENPAALFRERIKAQQYGRTDSTRAGDPNYVDNVVPDGGVNYADGKFFNLLQPGLDMNFAAMRKVGQGYQLPISFEYTTMPTAPAHAVLLGSCRELSNSCADVLMAKSGGKLTRNRREVRDLGGRVISS